jgi:ABC-type glycerol-3-phosphate transport system substrate-binding protein
MKKLGMAMLLCTLLLAACGGPKADVQIFMMTEQGIEKEQADKLQQSLTATVGSSPSVILYASPVYSLQKLIVEIAAGENSIIVVPEEQFLAFAAQGGYVPLDELFEEGQYPEGVMENPETKERHLYGIPMHQTKWFADAGYKGKGIYAFIPQNSANIEQAKQVLKAVGAQ